MHKWSSSDQFFLNDGYHFQSDVGNATLRMDYVEACKDTFEAYLVDLRDGRLREHMRARLDLDNDLYNWGEHDRELSHAVLMDVIHDLAPIAPVVISATTGQTVQQPQISQSGESKMSKITSIVNQAKAATVTAAEIQAGKALNIAAVKAVKSKAPLMVRGYMDHPAAPAVIALAVVSAGLPAEAKALIDA